MVPSQKVSVSESEGQTSTENIRRKLNFVIKNSGNHYVPLKKAVRQRDFGFLLLENYIEVSFNERVHWYLVGFERKSVYRKNCV